MKKAVSILILVCLMVNVMMISGYAESNELDVLYQKKQERTCGAQTVDLSDPVMAAGLKQYDENIDAVYGSMIKDEGRTALWEGVVTDLGASNHYGFHETFTKIFTLAKAYKKAGSKYYGNEALKKDIISALEFMQKAGYNDTTPLKEAAKGNWYYWEISVPQSIVGILFCMRDVLPKELCESYKSAMLHFIETPKTVGLGGTQATGANLAWECSLWISIGIIYHDPDMVKEGVEYMEPLFAYADDAHTADGFYKDGSFIQHENIAYNGGYGSSHVGEVLQVAELVAGTSYAFPGEKMQIMSDWVIKGFLPLICNGNTMDMVRGREIARANTTDRIRGISDLAMCFRIGLIADEQARKTILSEVRAQLENNTALRSSFMAFIPPVFKEQAEEMMTNPEYETIERPQMKIYNGMARATYKGSNFGLGIAMYSNKTVTHEYHSTEFENKRAWYTSHGATYLYTGDDTQYSRDFYPTVDPYMIAGITRADLKRNETEEGLKNEYAFAGGTSLNGQYGAVGLHMADWKNERKESLKARKSYFCFDGQIVAMGLVDTASENAKTVIEDRIIDKGSIVAYDNQGEVIAGDTENEVYKNIYFGGKNNVGYVLGSGTNAKLETQERKGAWSDISAKSYNTSEVKTNEFAKLYISHAAKKENQPYEYVILPGRTKNQVENYQAAEEYQILENSQLASGIISRKNNMEMINFWTQTPHTAGSVTANTPCSVIVKEADGKLMISVSDPTTSLDEIKVEIQKPAGELIAKPDEATVENDGGKIKLNIDTRKNHIGVFELSFQSDTDFVTEETISGDTELLVQEAVVFQMNSGTMLKALQKELIYPENPSVQIESKDGTAYIPLRTLTMLYDATVFKDPQSGETQMHANGHQISFYQDGSNIRIDGGSSEYTVMEKDGFIFIPLRFFLEQVMDMAVEYDDGLIITGTKGTVDKWNEKTTAAVKRILSEN